MSNISIFHNQIVFLFLITCTHSKVFMMVICVTYSNISQSDDFHIFTQIRSYLYAFESVYDGSNGVADDEDDDDDLEHHGCRLCQIFR
jgi:hypothetical protein